MIAVEKLTKQYGSAVAVNAISFEVAEGENLVLLGTSGCGKTTTLKMINRLITPTSGYIKVNGKDVTAQRQEELRRGIGYVLQHNGLFPHYTVYENIAIVPQLLKWDKPKIMSRVKVLLEKLRLDPDVYINSYPAQLSGGQQQRVNIARALAAAPPVLLMDEPFGALDPITRIQIRKEFSQLDEYKKKTIVMVTHDVQEAFEMGDRICIMDKGNIMQIGTPAEMLFKPQNDFIKSFLAGQRLQLAFRILKIDDIASLLPDGTGSVAETAIKNNTSIWAAMEQLADKNTTYEITYGKGGTKLLSWQLLMNAFNNYTNN